MDEAAEQRPAEGPLDATRAWAQYHRFVAGIAWRLLGRDDELDDVVQDVFLDAVRGLAALREPEAVKAWLATVTVRVARRRLRVRRVKHWLGMDGPRAYEEVAAQGVPLEQQQLLSRVYATLDRMPVEQRIAWTLRHIEGVALDDVAARCGCSLATAKRRIAAAQNILEREHAR